MTAPPREWRVALSDLAYDEAEEAAVLEVVRSRWLSMGERTAAFERRVAEMTGAPHAVAVSSCTAALYLMLAALDIGPGDEVLLPSLTFVATANVVVNRGATPVFCDVISPEIPLVDPAEIERRLSASTRAVLTVDYAGYPCDYDAIQAILGEFEAEGRRGRPGGSKGVALLEDAAHGIGGMLDESRALGVCADAGAFSFFSNKNVATGEGGMVVTASAAIAERVRLLRQHGLTSNTWDRHQSGGFGYDVVEAGWNFRPTEIQAALGLAQLAKLEVNQWRRHALVRRYQVELAELPETTVPFAAVKTWHFPACHVFPVLFPNEAVRRRVRETLQARGVQTSMHYPPIHTFDFYQRRFGGPVDDLPRTMEYAARELTLPLHPNMSPEDVDYVVAAVKEGLAGS